MKVAKFGGSSLADTAQIRKVIAIVASDPEIEVVVVSAPGKRHSEDEKITDLMYLWQNLASKGLPYDECMQKVINRFMDIAQDLGLHIDFDSIFMEIEHVLSKLGGSPAYAASRGEYLSGLILAGALGFEFVHPEKCINFTPTGKYIPDDEVIRKCLHDKKVVVPGFYGSVLHDSNQIRTFSRGGSDLTGALIAGALRASVYENWTDVSGLSMCDPRIVPSSLPIQKMTYKELRELSYTGANVFHEEAMLPVNTAKVSTNIRNTNDSTHPGTMIYPDLQSDEGRIVTGIAGRSGFAVITISKMLMNNEIGFVRKILSILENEEMSFHHMPGGIDTLSIILEGEDFQKKSERIIHRIKGAVQPDFVNVSMDIAMITVVGRRMACFPGVAAKVFTALAKRGINVETINQGWTELSIIIGVKQADREEAIRAIYASVEKLRDSK